MENVYSRISALLCDIRCVCVWLCVYASGICVHVLSVCLYGGVCACVIHRDLKKLLDVLPH